MTKVMCKIKSTFNIDNTLTTVQVEITPEFREILNSFKVGENYQTTERVYNIESKRKKVKVAVLNRINHKANILFCELFEKNLQATFEVTSDRNDTFDYAENLISNFQNAVINIVKVHSIVTGKQISAVEVTPCASPI